MTTTHIYENYSDLVAATARWSASSEIAEEDQRSYLENMIDAFLAGQIEEHEFMKNSNE